MPFSEHWSTIDTALTTEITRSDDSQRENRMNLEESLFGSLDSHKYSERGNQMSSSEFDVRMQVLEGRVEQAERVLDSVGRVLRSIERAHATADRGRSVPIVLLGAAAIVAASVVFVARHQQSA